MSGRKSPKRREIAENSFDQARNELFSHILRCGVLEADLEQQSEWFDDTMDYLADRYEYLSEEELAELRNLGQQYCRPIIRRDGPQSTPQTTQTVTTA